MKLTLKQKISQVVASLLFQFKKVPTHWNVSKLFAVICLCCISPWCLYRFLTFLFGNKVVKAGWHSVRQLIFKTESVDTHRKEIQSPDIFEWKGHVWNIKQKTKLSNMKDEHFGINWGQLWLKHWKTALILWDYVHCGGMSPTFIWWGLYFSCLELYIYYYNPAPVRQF